MKNTHNKNGQWNLTEGTNNIKTFRSMQHFGYKMRFVLVDRGCYMDLLFTRQIHLQPTILFCCELLENLFAYIEINHCLHIYMTCLTLVWSTWCMNVLGFRLPVLVLVIIGWEDLPCLGNVEMLYWRERDWSMTAL